jgi:hypothetical protein
MSPLARRERAVPEARVPLGLRGRALGVAEVEVEHVELERACVRGMTIRE